MIDSDQRKIIAVILALLFTAIAALIIGYFFKLIPKISEKIIGG